MQNKMKRLGSVIAIKRKKPEEEAKEQSRRCRDYEEKLGKIHENIENSLLRDKERRKQLRVECFGTRKRLTELEKDVNGLQLQFKESQKDSHRKILRTQQDLNIFNRKKHIQKSELDKKTLEKTQEISTLQTYLESLLGELEALESKVNSEKCELKRNKEKQVKHYLKLLKEGKDTRTEGLSWIVRVLWTLGINVYREHFPSFLDTQAIESIIQIAEKLTEKEKLNVKVYRPQKRHRKAQSSRDLLKIVKERIKNASYKINTRDLFTRQKSSYFDSFNEIPVKEDVEVALEIKKKTSLIEESLKRLKDQEITRLTSEYTLHKHDKKFRASLKEMISAVIGVESMQRRMATINRIRSNLSLQIASTRTFSFASSLLLSKR